MKKKKLRREIELLKLQVTTLQKRAHTLELSLEVNRFKESLDKVIIGETFKCTASYNKGGVGEDLILDTLGME